MLWDVLVCLDGVPEASGANRIGNRSSLDLEELLKLKTSGAIAPARLWLQVRDRRSGPGVAEAVGSEAGWMRKCEVCAALVRSQMRERSTHVRGGLNSLFPQKGIPGRRCDSTEAESGPQMRRQEGCRRTTEVEFLAAPAEPQKWSSGRRCDDRWAEDLFKCEGLAHFSFISSMRAGLGAIWSVIFIVNHEVSNFYKL